VRGRTELAAGEGVQGAEAAGEFAGVQVALAPVSLDIEEVLA